MRIYKLTKEEIGQIYHEKMPLDFPPEEIKPLERINSQYERGCYFGYGLMDQEVMLGYAFLVTTENKKWILLDYYAIGKEYRGRKCGTQFLELIKKELVQSDIKALIIEIESIRSASNSKEEHTRKRRRNFYITDCKIRPLKEFTTIFGTEYEVLYHPFKQECKKETIMEAYKKIYQNMLSKEMYEKNCCIGLNLPEKSVNMRTTS